MQQSMIEEAAIAVTTTATCKVDLYEKKLLKGDKYSEMNEEERDDYQHSMRCGNISALSLPDVKVGYNDRIKEYRKKLIDKYITETLTAMRKSKANENENKINVPLRINTRGEFSNQGPPQPEDFFDDVLYCWAPKEQFNLDIKCIKCQKTLSFKEWSRREVIGIDSNYICVVAKYRCGGGSSPCKYSVTSSHEQEMIKLGCSKEIFQLSPVHFFHTAAWTVEAFNLCQFLIEQNTTAEGVRQVLMKGRQNRWMHNQSNYLLATQQFKKKFLADENSFYMWPRLEELCGVCPSLDLIRATFKTYTACFIKKGQVMLKCDVSVDLPKAKKQKLIANASTSFQSPDPSTSSTASNNGTPRTVGEDGLEDGTKLRWSKVETAIFIRVVKYHEGFKGATKACAWVTVLKPLIDKLFKKLKQHDATAPVYSRSIQSMKDQMKIMKCRTEVERDQIVSDHYPEFLNNDNSIFS